MAHISNKDYALKTLQYGGFEGNTAKVSKEILQGAGWDSYQSLSSSDKEQFWNLIWQAYLDEVKGADIRVPKTFEYIVDYRSNPFGGQLRRIRVHRNSKPTSPKGLNMVKGAGANPFLNRTPKVTEEYWKVNFPYYNNLTIDNKQVKLAFTSQDGIDKMISEYFKLFDQERLLQEHENIEYIFNSVISRNTLNTDQVREVKEVTEASSRDDIVSFLSDIQNLYTYLDKTPLHTKFNEAGFETGINPNKMVLFVRSDIMNAIKNTVWTTAFNREFITNLKFDIEEVPAFGTPIYKKNNTVMVPVYSTNPADAGAVLGYNATGSEEDEIFQPYDLDVTTGEQDTLAVLMEKGTLFISDNDKYRVESIYNPADEKTNFFGKQYNRTYGYDKTCNFIKFVKESA